MPVVQALVVELARRVVAGELEEPALVEGFADRFRRARHHRDMGKADLARIHRLNRAIQVRQSPANREPVGRRVGCHPAVDADPIQGAVEAFIVPKSGFGEGCGSLGEPQLEPVDLPTKADQVKGQARAIRRCGDGGVEHATNLRT